MWFSLKFGDERVHISSIKLSFLCLFLLCLALLTLGSLVFRITRNIHVDWNRDFRMRNILENMDGILDQISFSKEMADEKEFAWST